MKLRLFLLSFATCIAACSQLPQKQMDNNLYVSILPLKYILRNIVHDDFQIKVLVPAGASPETFEPTPKQFVELNRARFIFNVGLIDFENSLLDKINEPEKVVDLHVGIDLIEGACAHGKHNDNGIHHDHGVDPHVWTSPKALKIMARNAFEAIQQAFPDSTKYADAYKRLQQQLEDLDNRTHDKIKRSGVEAFIVYHPALTYYARDYGIRQMTIETDGKEPSARQLAELIRTARQYGINKVFYQNQFPKSVVEVLARDMKARYVEIDPLDEQVIENIDRITDLIVEP